MTDFKTDSDKQILFLADEASTIKFAEDFAKACEATKAYENGLMVYLNGDLGAGKSFLSRAFVQHYLPGQKVKSPTYTIVETYNCYKFNVHHLDLYRLCDPEELEYLAVRDLLSADFIALVEWPQRGTGYLPSADVEINLTHQEQGRHLELQAKTPKGSSILKGLSSF